MDFPINWDRDSGERILSEQWNFIGINLDESLGRFLINFNSIISSNLSEIEKKTGRIAVKR